MWKLWSTYHVPDLFPSSDPIPSSESFSYTEPSKPFPHSTSTFLSSPFTLGFTRKELSTSDGASISYRVYPGASHVPTVIFVHGLFGNSHLFHSVASTLSLGGVPSISIDLRGFGNSSLGNTKRLTIEVFAQDILSILQNEGITQENEQIEGVYDSPLGYRSLEPIILVGYSMGTLVTSLIKKHLSIKQNIQEGRGRQHKDNGGPLKDNHGQHSQYQHSTNPNIIHNNIRLFHVSPIMDIKKRRFLRHVFIPGLGELDLKLLLRPLVFFRLVFEVLSSRHLVELSGYVVSGLRDFCFCRDESFTHPGDMSPNVESPNSPPSDSSRPPYILYLFKQEDHYLIYRIPNILTNYLFLVIFGTPDEEPCDIHDANNGIQNHDSSKDT